MQILENNQLDVDDPMDDFHGPVRLPQLKRGTYNVKFIIFYPKLKIS